MTSLRPMHPKGREQQLGVIAASVIWLAVYFCLWQGRKSVGKALLYTVPIPVGRIEKWGRPGQCPGKTLVIAITIAPIFAVPLAQPPSQFARGHLIRQPVPRGLIMSRWTGSQWATAQGRTRSLKARWTRAPIKVQSAVEQQSRAAD